MLEKFYVCVCVRVKFLIGEKEKKEKGTKNAGED